MSTLANSPVFSFQSHQIRTAIQNNQPWFSVADICKALSLPWSGATLKPIPKEWQGLLKLNNLPKSQPLRVISEPAVYKLAFRSNKPQADIFTNWVASEVLPAIRKTGKYEVKPRPEPKQLPLPPADHGRDIRALADEVRRLMWQASEVYRDLWSAVERAAGDINRQRGILGEAKRDMLANLHRATSTAFTAHESLADTVAYNIRAMRMLAG